MTPTTTSEMNAGWRNLVYLAASLVIAAIGVFGVVVLEQKPHWLFLAAAGIASVVVGVAKIVGVID